MRNLQTADAGGPWNDGQIEQPTAALRLFAAARQAAGTASATFPGRTVGDVLAAAVEAYGPGFSAVLETSRVWLNGQPAEASAVVATGDEVAVLPPVSGGV